MPFPAAALAALSLIRAVQTIDVETREELQRELAKRRIQLSIILERRPRRAK
jgi:hypothetical protein